MANVPPFVRVADALDWALDRIRRAGLKRAEYFQEAERALERENAGRVFHILTTGDDDGARWWFVCRRNVFSLGLQPTGIAYGDAVPFPQAKAQEEAELAEMKLREDLDRWHTRAAVLALQSLGRDPFRELVLCDLGPRGRSLGVEQ